MGIVERFDNEAYRLFLILTRSWESWSALIVRPKGCFLIFFSFVSPLLKSLFIDEILQAFLFDDLHDFIDIFLSFCNSSSLVYLGLAIITSTKDFKITLY